MGSFKIVGGKKLSGTITPQGAKNEALQVISAVLLTESEITIRNIPNILDVICLMEILEGLGVTISKIDKNTYKFQAKNINKKYLLSQEFQNKSNKIRGSVMIMGPLLARLNSTILYPPGGDKIGRRRLDTHFVGLEKLGANFELRNNNSFKVSCKKLTGKFILLEEASVTGTANIIMAAVMAQGTTTVYNAACEPYVQQLCKMLNSMGADIKGIGSNKIKINGVSNEWVYSHNSTRHD